MGAGWALAEPWRGSAWVQATEEVPTFNFMPLFRTGPVTIKFCGRFLECGALAGGLAGDLTEALAGTLAGASVGTLVGALAGTLAGTLAGALTGALPGLWWGFGGALVGF